MNRIRATCLFCPSESENCIERAARLLADQWERATVVRDGGVAGPHVSIALDQLTRTVREHDQRMSEKAGSD